MDTLWLELLVSLILIATIRFRTAVDIGLDELTKTFPSGEQVYTFLVDHHGILLYHPKLMLPVSSVPVTVTTKF